jgi:hypothetical protein
MHVELDIIHKDLDADAIRAKLQGRFNHRDMKAVDRSRYFAGHDTLIAEVIDAYVSDEYLLFALQDDLTTLRLIIEPQDTKFKKVSQRVLNDARKSLKGYRPRRFTATLYDDAFDIMKAETNLSFKLKAPDVYLSIGVAVLTMAVFGYLAFKKDFGLWPVFIGIVPVLANGLFAFFGVIGSLLTRRLIWRS